jgi:tRNA (mo5U34)-methyltransferase
MQPARRLAVQARGHAWHPRCSGSKDVTESTATREALSPDAIAKRIAELGDWFHNMTLGGQPTAPHHFLGDYPAIKWRQFADALPDDLTGRSVLDVGCNAGFYSIEMKRRGADRVVGIDWDERYLNQAKFAAEMSGVDVEFRRLSVYDVATLRERFDVVLFMGVLYHLRHPLLALDLLHEHATRDLFVFQSMLRGSSAIEPLSGDYPFSETAIFDRPGYPRLHFVEHRYTGDRTNWWLPNRAAAEAMLRSAGYAILGHPETEVFICRHVPLPDAEPRAVYPRS